MDATVASRSAPARSILWTKTRRGTACRSACRHTASLCGCTPATASNTATAPSRTRSEPSTSSAKLTWAGVPIRLIRCAYQAQLGRREDGDTAVAFLRVEVGDGAAVVDLALPVRGA